MPITITFANQVHQILRQGSLILTSIFLVKSGLAVQALGIFESLMYITTVISFFWLNAFLQGILAQYPSVEEGEKPIFRFNIVVLTVFFTILLVLLFTFFEKEFLLFLTAESHLQYFDIFKIYIILHLPPFILESFWTVEDKPISLLTYSIVSNFLLPLSITLPLVCGFDFEKSILSMIIVAAIRFGWLLTYVFKNTLLRFDKALMYGFLSVCLPLMGYSFLSGFTASFSNWLVSWWYVGDKGTFAIYRMGAREFPLSLALATGLSGAIVPFLSSSEVNKASLLHLKIKTTQLWHILFPSSIALMWSSDWIFRHVFSADYSQSAIIFNVYLLILLSRILFPQSVLLALKETGLMLKISIVETVSIIILSFVFVPFWGIEGIAWATVLGFLIEKILMVFYLKKKHHIDFQEYTNIKLYFFYASLLLLSFVVVQVK